ncbi:unnamed protein product [Linum trigynum]|uniref:Uncharacterized protein n=1 Tax=Linum trigynum TaxID=586398 RepID=A0AAV2G6W3_9ROSI
MGKEKNVGGGKCLFSSYIPHIPSRKNSTHFSPLQNLTVALSSAEIDGGRKPSSCSPTVGSPSPAGNPLPTSSQSSKASLRRSTTSVPPTLSRPSVPLESPPISSCRHPGIASDLPCGLLAPVEWYVYQWSGTCTSGVVRVPVE